MNSRSSADCARAMVSADDGAASRSRVSARNGDGGRTTAYDEELVGAVLVSVAEAVCESRLMAEILRVGCSIREICRAALGPICPSAPCKRHRSPGRYRHSFQ